MSTGPAPERWRRIVEEAGELSAAEYVRVAARAGIGSKSALVEHAAIAKGLATTRWSRTEVLIHVPGEAAPIYFHAMNGPRSIGGKFYCDEKAVARDLLSRAGLAVATSQAFDPSELHEGLRYAQRIGYPVVVKPTNLARGMGVTANIQTPEAFGKAWRRASTARQRRSRPVLVEKHFHGNDFRAFVVGDDIVSVTQRKAANVVGDGHATVGELIERKNAIRAQNPYLCDHPIPTRLESLDLLASAGLTVSHVPAPGEIVVLRSASNLSAGGDSIDFTEDAHPGFIDIAIRAVRAIPGLAYAGVDLITPDITVPPTTTNYIVSEVEYSPAMLAHFPLIGTPRDMAGAVLRYYLDHGPGYG